MSKSNAIITCTFITGLLFLLGGVYIYVSSAAPITAVPQENDKPVTESIPEESNPDTPTSPEQDISKTEPVPKANPNTSPIPEDTFPDECLNLYFESVDVLIKDKILSEHTPDVFFRETTYSATNPNDLLKEINEAKEFYSGPGESLESTDSNLNSEAIPHLEQLSLLAREPSLRIAPRYPKMDSYVWNTVVLDSSQKFDDITENENRDTTKFFYQSSKISLPKWEDEGVKLNLWTIPNSQKEVNNQIIAISAPFNNSLIMDESHTLPQQLNLSDNIKEEEGIVPGLVIDNRNLMYFFKMIINFKVKMVVAVCADPDNETETKGDNLKFNFQSDLAGMNKCHLYWRIKFQIDHLGEKYSVTPQLLPQEGIKLYKTYELTIAKEGSDWKHTVKVNVLSEWPDFSPLPDEMVPDLLTLYNTLYTTVNTPSNEPDGKFMIHCSAGAGRTGSTIMGYLMYNHFREFSVLTGMDTSTSLKDLIQKYSISENGQSLMLAGNEKMKEKQPVGFSDEMMKAITSSPLVAYVFDLLIYLRFRRMHSVEKISQFQYLIRFASMLTVEALGNVLSSEGSVVETTSKDHLRILI